MGNKQERGAIVVEATISFTAFIFAIFLVLSVVRIFTIQARMSVALNTAAKELSQYSYLYFKFGVDEIEKGWNDSDTGEARATAQKTADGLSEVMTSLNNAYGSAESGDFDNMAESLKNGGQTAESLIEMYGDKIAGDPKELIMGMGKLAGNEIKEKAKMVVFGQVLGKTLMKKNLKAYPEDTAEDFVRRYRVVNGLKGLNFNYTVILPMGEPDINLVVTYEVEVLRLLNVEYKFKFRQMAKTKAWGNGVSEAPETPGEDKPAAGESWWDSKGGAQRGKLIVAEERAKLSYQNTGHGYDGYENVGGKDQFIGITSLDSFSASYQEEGKIAGELGRRFRNVYNGAPKAGETFSVTNSSGATVDKTRNGQEPAFKMILVVPENADTARINKEVADFKDAIKRSYDCDVTVEVKRGYGTSSTGS